MSAVAFMAFGLVLCPSRYWLNRERGKDTKDRVFCAPKLVIYVAFAFITLCAFAVAMGGWFNGYIIAVALLMLIACEWFHYSAGGWGKWFPHADKDTSGEYEAGEWLVDRLAALLCGYKHNAALYEQNPFAVIHYKKVAFSIRFALWSAPKYLLLSYLCGSCLPMLGVVMLAPAGLIYGRYSRKYGARAAEKRIPPSERMTGLLVGLSDAAIATTLSIQYLVP